MPKKSTDAKTIAGFVIINHDKNVKHGKHDEDNANATKNNETTRIITSTEYKKQSIPKPRRKEVWEKYCGNNFGFLCFCCNQAPITAFEFECGHVVAEKHGGSIDVSNLRPICSCCNKSMRTEAMLDFMKRLNYKPNQHWNGYQKSTWFSFGSCLSTE